RSREGRPQKRRRSPICACRGLKTSRGVLKLGMGGTLGSTLPQTVLRSLTLTRLKRLKTSTLSSAVACPPSENSRAARTSTLKYAGPSSVFLPSVPTRSELGLPSPLASAPTYSVKKRPLLAVIRDANRNPPSTATLRGTSLMKENVPRWPTCCRESESSASR